MKRRSRPGKARRAARKASRRPKARKARAKPKRPLRKARSPARHSPKKRPSARKASGRAKGPMRKKARSRAFRQKALAGPSMVSEPLEQVTVACANCGRQFTVVKIPGLSLEGMICQRCELGEIEFPE